ncbi:hypothetical protein LINPERHAP1_LOCUS21632 [Linum perenne]
MREVRSTSMRGLSVISRICRAGNGMFGSLTFTRRATILPITFRERVGS